jgi:dipeptidyl aminopeptidase/acylaminoacyl peptidase
MRRQCFIVVAAVLSVGWVAVQNCLLAADKQPMKLDDLFAMKRVAAPQISPDGKHVAYQVTAVDLEKNKSTTSLWIAATDGKTPPKQLLDPKGKKDTAPRWSPDGKRILFESNRSGSPQLWVTTPEGDEPKQITNISTGASNGIWSPDGTHIAFVSVVYPDFSEKPFAEADKLNKQKDDEIEKSRVKAKVFTKLFSRHWVEYVGDKRRHLFVCKADGSDCRNVTPGDRDAHPTSSTFTSGDDFTFTPDSTYLVFTAVPEKDEAWSTNYDLCRVSITNTSPKWETLTKDNKAADSGPKFSPDGKKLAWRAQKREGYEADKWDIVVVDVKPDGTLAGKPVSLLDTKDISANEFVWQLKDQFAFTADRGGSTKLFYVTLNRKDLYAEGEAFDNGSVQSLTASANDSLACVFAALNTPPEVWTLVWTEKTMIPGQRSHANDALLAQLDLPKPEAVEVPVEGDVKMHMWVLKPPGFDDKRKWPVVYLVHGGPQSAWRDAWSYRWNPQVWAAEGYIVVMPNPRGSVGFGQKFTDEIPGDWGGKCYRDLVAGLDHVEKWSYVDKDRIAAAGGSFGGYMMNWFAVNDIAKRFKCLVTHCSVWNFESMWGTTDELWFDEFEHGGLPWEQPEKYRKFSPHTKAAKLKEYKCPMLVIHNDLDFRCPIGQGHELFTALQRQGVPSRFVNFPDEGHWVLKPKNSERWHKEIFGWLAKYAPPGPK